MFLIFISIHLDKSSTTYNIFDYSKYFASKDDSLVCKKPFFNINEDGSFFPSESVLSPVFTSSTAKDSGHVGISQMFSLEQVDGVFLLLLFCFILLVQVYKNGFFFFKESFHSFISNRIDVNASVGATTSEFWRVFFLLFQTFFLSAIILFIFFVESDLFNIAPRYSFVILIQFVILIFLVEGTKSLIYKFVGFLFNIQDVMNKWIKDYRIMTQMLGFLFFIPLLLLIYSDYFHDILFVLFLVLFVMSRLLLFYRVSVFFLHNNINLLYLIVYLCAIEIVPYILLYEGLKYLYKIDLISLL